MNNLRWVGSRGAAWTATQGELAGYLDGAYGDGFSMAPWQQDYLTGVVAWAAMMGYTEAMPFLDWNKKLERRPLPAA